MNYNIISADDWRMGHHPIMIQALSSDFYYGKLCTKLLKKINELFKIVELRTHWASDLALMLGYYVEDVVSNTHVFDSFRKINMRLFGKKLPFYHLSSNYFDDEVNLEDVKFLVWDFVQQVRGDDALINPDNEAIAFIATRLFDIVGEAYEEAPETTELHDLIFDPANYIDFVESKRIQRWLLFYNPLTMSRGIQDDIADNIEAIYNENPDTDISLPKLVYDLEAIALFKKRCRWNSVPVFEVLAQMLETEGLHEIATKMSGARHTDLRTFERIASDGHFMTIVDTRTAQKYLVDNRSFGSEIPSPTSHRYITTDLASFDGKTWEINGMSLFNAKPAQEPEYINDEEVAYKHNLERLGGKLIGYFKDTDDMRRTLIGDNSIILDNNLLADLGNDKNIVVFLNPNGSLFISPNLALTTPDPENPFFKAIDNTELMSSALNPQMASTAMARYYYDQGWYDDVALSSLLSPKRGHELFHDNFEFLLRYFRDNQFDS